MRILISGAAGFIGSNLVDFLLDRGHDVIGIDAFLPNYAESNKRANLIRAHDYDSFRLIESNLLEIENWSFVEGLDAICHLAGMPGVRTSWDQDQLPMYLASNVAATERILSVARQASVRAFTYASSSSVYGGSSGGKCLQESDLPRPTSPYAVTKLSGEHLCTLYGTELDVPTLSLRFFTVYGPRQRPDMAMFRIIQAALTQEPFVIFGDGNQTRDFTFVEDVVGAVALTLGCETPNGAIANIGGGSPVTLLEVIRGVEELLGVSIPLQFVTRGPGDPSDTKADVRRAREFLDWRPQVDLPEGLQRQLTWQMDRA